MDWAEQEWTGMLPRLVVLPLELEARRRRAGANRVERS